MNHTWCFQPNMHENVIFPRLPEVSSSGAGMFCSGAGDLGIQEGFSEPKRSLRLGRSWQLTEEWLMRCEWGQEIGQGPHQRVCLIYPGVGQCLHPHRAAEWRGSSVELTLWVEPGPFWGRDRQQSCVTSGRLRRS